uniref:Cyclin C-terminal domain-containing protein n=1 Tax=Aotus nancymaae TaxID=37293 RepID=A0A2K5DJY7_AOTNA
MPRERRERDAKERDIMVEDGGAEFSVRSRKRKANVANPDEEMAKIDRTARDQCGSQAWDNNAVCADPCSLIPTPVKEEDELVYPNSMCKPRHITPSRGSPLPVLSWANREEVWKIMLNKEKTYLRDKCFLEQHPLLQPKMRAILLDWLMEVGEGYTLHRETFYLLIGISSLFIAAKLEEIYPPKLHQFAYVTDGACSDEILTMEFMIMKLLDICVLDVDCLEFPYGILAASAVYHFSSSELMQKVSGYEWCDIENCVKWMVPFAMVIREMGTSKRKHFRRVADEDVHNIQTHRDSWDLLDKARAKKAMLSEQNRASPLPSGLFTPPQSNKKQSNGPEMA